MSSDNIKTALAAAYPTSSEKDWKRRSKSKVPGGTERTFENAVLGITVSTVEDASGNVTVNGADAPVIAKAPASPQSVATTVAPAPTAKVSKPAVKAVGVAAIRTQMVPNSKWRFTRDVEIVGWRDSPKYKQHVSARPDGRNNLNAYNDWRIELDRLLESGESQVLVPVGKVLEGAEFTVTGKISSEASYGSEHKKSDGLKVPLAITPDKIELYSLNGKSPSAFDHPLIGYQGVHELPLRQIADAVEPLAIPTTLVYVLRDTATGELFGGWKTEKVAYYTDKQDVTHYSDRATDEPKMVTKLSSAKKYATSAAVKASIREFTGYNSGLDNNVDSGEYYIMGGDKKMDLPPTWEMVVFNKVTGDEVETIDVQNWYKSSKRLRVLTTSFGSAVRGVYKKAEGKGMEAIIVFQNRSRGTTHDGKSWDEASRFDDYHDGHKSLEAINEALNKVSGKTLREKSPSSVAMAGSLADCFMARLALDDAAKVEVKILDINTLEEVVETQ